MVRGLEQDAKDASCLFAMSDPALTLRRAQARNAVSGSQTTTTCSTAIVM
jgi:hypothetical protein